MTVIIGCIFIYITNILLFLSLLLFPISLGGGWISVTSSGHIKVVSIVNFQNQSSGFSEVFKQNDQNDPLKTTLSSNFAWYSSDVCRQKWRLCTPKNGVQKWSLKLEGCIPMHASMGHNSSRKSSDLGYPISSK